MIHAIKQYKFKRRYLPDTSYGMCLEKNCDWWNDGWNITFTINKSLGFGVFNTSGEDTNYKYNKKEIVLGFLSIYYFKLHKKRGFYENIGQY